MQSVRHPPHPQRHLSVHPWETLYLGRASAAVASCDHARQCQHRRDDTSSACDAGAVGVGVVVDVVDAADVDAAVGAAVADVDADGDDAQRAEAKRMMEDQAILALKAQRVDVYAKNKVTVVEVVDLAGVAQCGWCCWW